MKITRNFKMSICEFLYIGKEEAELRIKEHISGLITGAIADLLLNNSNLNDFSPISIFIEPVENDTYRIRKDIERITIDGFVRGVRFKDNKDKKLISPEEVFKYVCGNTLEYNIKIETKEKYTDFVSFPHKE